ncbi:hypothetical protein VOLCADRAFT_108421 [Volvox carteri f. nagariensis]|uniref:Uncharacterized protein n=1 Tax=Volvox carteri f. nagariensis TaxID=3068 RepID=D8UK24_VOLCA|nr:uncharacterized protein VOLCADRAFT_108421 [Volvox carteri f. nagariensis]EFJ39937.1 hypothetical protein VOLCADRAFT_108421 [Volvox carteri f. nagariensis]|eukprot:XP_002959018.1 hypothetical protein VOLCADRAFT_108421 [Volvox carteri f. nagariensis]
MFEILSLTLNSPGVTAVARANGVSGPVAHKLRNYLRQKALKMDAFIAELVKASEYYGAKHMQEALMTTLGINALESSTLVRVLVPKDNNKRRNRLPKVQQEDKATDDAVYDVLKAKLQNAMANHQSEKKKSDFFKAIGLTTADKAQLETVATLDAIHATELFKEWVPDHVEVSTQPAGQERKKSNHTAATEGQANVMETQQEPLGQKSSRQDGDEGDDGDYSGEDEGEGREDEGEGGEDEGGEDEGGEEEEGTGGKVLLEEYGRSKSQKVHSKSVPQPTGRRKVTRTGKHDKGKL